MAQLALGVVGAVIGGVLTWSPYGAALGFAIGSAIGTVAFPPKGPSTTGPRLADTKVQNATYGAPIPWIRANYRLAGNVIWARNLHEVSTTVHSGGKNLSGPSSSSTTFSYFGRFAVGLCEGIAHVEKIWANGKLIYDTSSGLDKYGVWTFYQGTETQTPDPFMQSLEGASLVPAYRGLCYLVAEDLPLADFGNVFPNVEALVCSGAAAPVPLLCGYHPTGDVFFVESFTGIADLEQHAGETAEWFDTFTNGINNLNLGILGPGYTNGTLFATLAVFGWDVLDGDGMHAQPTLFGTDYVAMLHGTILTYAGGRYNLLPDIPPFFDVFQPPVGVGFEVSMEVHHPTAGGQLGFSASAGDDVTYTNSHGLAMRIDTHIGGSGIYVEGGGSGAFNLADLAADQYYLMIAQITGTPNVSWSTCYFVRRSTDNFWLQPDGTFKNFRQGFAKETHAAAPPPTKDVYVRDIISGFRTESISGFVQADVGSAISAGVPAPNQAMHARNLIGKIIP